MKNIGQNEVQEKWNSLGVYDVKDILERSGIRWNHCHLLRLGLEGKEKYDPVVLVGVERDSTSQVDATISEIQLDIVFRIGGSLPTSRSSFMRRKCGMRPPAAPGF